MLRSDTPFVWTGRQEDLERALKVSPEIYDNTTITLHWATAILVAIQFLIGTTTNFLPCGPLRVDIWSIHVMFGFTLAIVVVAGGDLACDSRSQIAAARTWRASSARSDDASAAGPAVADHGRTRHH